MHIGPTTGVCYDSQGNVYSSGYDGRVVAWKERCSDARWVACHDGLVNSLIADDGEIISVVRIGSFGDGQRIPVSRPANDSSKRWKSATP